MERRTAYTLTGLATALTLLLVFAGKAPQSAAASLHVPTADDEVLEVLPITASDPRVREMDRLRAALSTSPTDLPTAVRLARMDIELSRERADPRYLGRAQAALAPWWALETPPVDVLVLRATIEQSLHDFDAALTDLDRAARLAPGHPQVWLTRAVVLGVRGRYTEARQSCGQLVRLTSSLVVAVCETAIDSVTGQAALAFDRLQQELARSADLTPDEEAWARSSLGEYAIRLGRFDDAERELRRTLEIDPNDNYTRAAAADLLLDRGNPGGALELVRGREANDALLLRIAIAEQRSHAPEAANDVAALGARFDASRLRGDVVHRREEARYWLELGNDAPRALELAKANWDVQKEPADARILLESALAARQPGAATALLEWLTRSKLEDPFIAKLVTQLRGTPSP